MGNPTLATATFLLGIVLAPPLASQSKPTSKPQKPTPDDHAQKQARRWVTFLELDDRRAEATNALLKMGAKAVPVLVHALDHPRGVVTQRVCHILGFGSQAATAKDRLVKLSKSKNPNLARAARYALASIQPTGVTLVADLMANKVLELDKAGKVVRTLTDVSAPGDAERLPNGNYLICLSGADKVVEMTAKGRVVWSYTGLRSPYKAQRLLTGNTLIADGVDNRVLEVDRGGKIVWKYGIRSCDAERLANGNTLIVDGGAQRVIEVSPKGEIVWQHEVDQIAMDADRLPNGNTLIALTRPGKVIEVNSTGQVVRELRNIGEFLNEADRLPNGHTLVAQRGKVSEYDAKGKVVWSAKMWFPVAVNRY